MQNIDYVGIIPKITPNDLEKILNCLPEPTNATVILVGFDYCDIFKQAKKINPNIELEGCPYINLNLCNPTKKNILDIYRKASYKEDGKEYDKEYKIPRIDLDAIIWDLDNLNIKVTPSEVVVGYNGKEPEHIKNLRKEILGTNIRIQININSSNDLEALGLSGLFDFVVE